MVNVILLECTHCKHAMQIHLFLMSCFNFEAYLWLGPRNHESDFKILPWPLWLLAHDEELRPSLSLWKRLIKKYHKKYLTLACSVQHRSSAARSNLGLLSVLISSLLEKKHFRKFKSRKKSTFFLSRLWRPELCVRTFFSVWSWPASLLPLRRSIFIDLEFIWQQK